MLVRADRGWSPRGQRAREGLIAGGDLVYAGYTYYEAVYYLLECAPSLDVYVAEVEAGLAFLRRTGSEQTGQVLDSHQWLAGVLRGEGSAEAGDAAVLSDRYAGNPLALLFAHVTRAVAAAIFGDPAALARHTAAAMPLLAAAPCSYPTAGARLLRGLAVAGLARAADGDERDGLLSELDEVTRWLAERAADAPRNFLHLLRLVEAERAWAVGDLQAAELAFGAARREAARLQRPWHRALIAERAAGFYLARGVEHVGYDLLVQARQRVPRLGCDGESRPAGLGVSSAATRARRDRRHGPGQPAYRASGSSAVTTGAIDLLGILAASQALSSETSVEGLHSRVAEVLGAMTGATGVRLLLWSDDRHDWLLPVPDSSGSAVGSAAPATNPRCRWRCCATSSGRGSRWWWTTPPQTTASPATPTLPTSHAVRCSPCPSSAEGPCGPCWCWRTASSAARSPPNGSTRSSSSPASSPSPSTTPSCTPSSAGSPTSRPRCGGWRRWSPARRRLAEVFAAVTTEVGRVLGTDYTSLFRYDPDGEATAVAAWARTGVAAPVPVGSRLTLGGRNVTTLVFQQAGRRGSTTTPTPPARPPILPMRGASARRSERRSTSRAGCGGS